MNGDRPTVGILWGDFPWHQPPGKFGKLLSWGSVARNMTRALSMIATVVPGPTDPRLIPHFLEKIDILWADFYPASVKALELRRQRHIQCRALLFAGGTLPKGAEAILFPGVQLLRSDDQIIFSSQADQQIWRRLVEFSTLEKWVVPCPIDDTVFTPGVDNSDPRLLYVGRINIQKNLHGLLRVFAAVKQQIPAARLDIVGEEDDIALVEFSVSNDGYLDRLKSLAAELGISDAVHFHSPLFGTDLADMYRTASVAVNMSVYHRENFGMSQAEAQACGTPVVCTDWGGFSGIVRPGETGFLVDTILTDNGIRVDLRSAVRHLVSILSDAAMRSRMADAATTWAAEQFGIQAVSGRLSPIVAGPHSTHLDPAYRVSPFARQLERHKRASGWYTPRSAIRMFQGGDYQLYETLIGPYATHLASDYRPDGDAVPYLSPSVTLGPDPIALDSDELWPAVHHLDAQSYDLAARIDGRTSVDQLAVSRAADRIAALHRRGIVLF